MRMRLQDAAIPLFLQSISLTDACRGVVNGRQTLKPGAGVAAGIAFSGVRPRPRGHPSPLAARSPRSRRRSSCSTSRRTRCRTCRFSSRRGTPSRATASTGRSYLSSVQVKAVHTADGREVIKLTSIDPVTDPVHHAAGRGQLGARPPGARVHDAARSAGVRAGSVAPQRAPQVAAPRHRRRYARRARSRAQRGAGTRRPPRRSARARRQRLPLPTAPATLHPSAGFRERRPRLPQRRAWHARRRARRDALRDRQPHRRGAERRLRPTRAWMLAIYQANPRAFDQQHESAALRRRAAHPRRRDAVGGIRPRRGRGDPPPVRRLARQRAAAERAEARPRKAALRRSPAAGRLRLAAIAAASAGTAPGARASSGAAGQRAESREPARRIQSPAAS